MTRTLCCIALLGLVGCGGWKDRDGWVNEGEPNAVPEGGEAVFQAAREWAPCRIEPWGGWVEWRSEAIDCGGVRAAGCYIGWIDKEARVQVVGRPHFNSAMYSALPHEICHYILHRCEDDAGESARHKQCVEEVTRRAWFHYYKVEP